MQTAPAAATSSVAAPARPPAAAPAEATLRLALPKGRMAAAVEQLLRDAGLPLRPAARDYRPVLAWPASEVKQLKPQCAVGLLAAGSRDAAFVGADWVAELGADLIELLDTGLDPVRIVVAAPPALLLDGRLPRRPLRVAGELERLARAWIERRGAGDRFIRTWGATEVYPPEDADCIVDVVQTGETLRANGLVEVEELVRSSTRLYASPAACSDPVRRARLDELVLLLGSVLEARRRVVLEVNVSAARLESLIAAIPAMKRPTVSELFGGAGFAVKAAVPRADLAALIPRLRACGGTDILVGEVAQIVP